jgi:hypothetical protein
MNRKKPQLKRPLLHVLSLTSIHSLAPLILGAALWGCSEPAWEIPRYSNRGCQSLSECEAAYANFTDPSTGTSGTAANCCEPMANDPSCYAPRMSCSGEGANDEGAGAAVGTAAVMGDTATTAITDADNQADGGIAETNPEGGPAVTEEKQAAEGEFKLDPKSLSKDSTSLGALDIKPNPVKGAGAKQSNKKGSGGGAIQAGGTGPASGEKTDITLAMNAANPGSVESTGLYGAGKGGAQSGATGSGLTFGGTSEIGSGGGGQMDFPSGSQPGTSSEIGQFSQTEDPEDYLTRIGIDESLFKRVEKKHTEKQRLWLNESRPNKLK